MVSVANIGISLCSLNVPYSGMILNTMVYFEAEVGQAKLRAPYVTCYRWRIPHVKSPAIFVVVTPFFFSVSFLPAQSRSIAEVGHLLGLPSSPYMYWIQGCMYGQEQATGCNS